MARLGCTIISQVHPLLVRRVLFLESHDSLPSLHPLSRVSSGASMQVYATRTEQLSIGGHTYRLRVLSDKRQFSDIDGHRAHSGLSATQWGLFGQLWPSERLLAQAMHRFAVDGKR